MDLPERLLDLHADPDQDLPTTPDLLPDPNLTTALDLLTIPDLPTASSAPDSTIAVEEPVAGSSVMQKKQQKEQKGKNAPSARRPTGRCFKT